MYLTNVFSINFPRLLILIAQLYVPWSWEEFIAIIGTVLMIQVTYKVDSFVNILNGNIFKKQSKTKPGIKSDWNQ